MPGTGGSRTGARACWLLGSPRWCGGRCRPVSGATHCCPSYLISKAKTDRARAPQVSFHPVSRSGRLRSRPGRACGFSFRLTLSLLLGLPRFHFPFHFRLQPNFSALRVVCVKGLSDPFLEQRSARPPSAFPGGLPSTGRFPKAKRSACQLWAPSPSVSSTALQFPRSSCRKSGDHFVSRCHRDPL